MNSEAEERSSLQAKLDETDAKLVATELSRSQAVLEADELTKTLEHQFTDKLEEYKVRGDSSANPFDGFFSGASPAVCPDYSGHGEEVVEHDGKLQGTAD